MLSKGDACRRSSHRSIPTLGCLDSSLLDRSSVIVASAKDLGHGDRLPRRDTCEDTYTTWRVTAR